MIRLLIALARNRCKIAALAALTVVSDNCTELTPWTILRLSKERWFGWHYNALGMPIRDSLAESFNGCLMDECLIEMLSTSSARNRFVLAALQHYYSTDRLHSKLGEKTLAEMADQRIWGQVAKQVGVTSKDHHVGAALYL